MTPAELSALVDRIRQGEFRAAAWLMRALDDREPDAQPVLAALYPYTGQAQVIGMTGPPGSGKSTLTSQLVTKARQRGIRVGVVAIDPTSPLTGGAILGDRVRMNTHATDPDVFIRSLATRGALGGLCRAAADVVTVMDAMGFPEIFVETVGVGQDEVDIMRLADTVVVVAVPGLGDEVQALKAGLLEVADVLVVNKADREGADRAVRDLEMMLDLRAAGRGTIEVIKTVATDARGVDDLQTAIARHRASQQSTTGWGTRRQQAAAARIRILVLDELGRRAEARLRATGGIEALAVEVATRRLDPYTAASRILAS